MNIRRCFYLLFLSALLLGLAPSIRAAASSSGPEDAVVRKDEAQNAHWYRNNYFGFGMAIPGNWHVTLNRELVWFIHDPYLKKQIKDGIVLPLLGITKYPPGKPGPRGEVQPQHYSLCA